MRRLKTAQAISLAISIFLAVFIFANSAQPADESADMSGGLLLFINDIFAYCGIDVILSHHVLRKCAHFIEFFAVGVSLMVTTATFTKRLRRHIIKPVLISLAIAAIDETIQLFPPGRSAQASDVALDFTGAVCGIMFSWLVIYLINKKAVSR